MGSPSIVQNSTTILPGMATLIGVGNRGFQIVAIQNGRPPKNDAFGLGMTDSSGNVAATSIFNPPAPTGGSIQATHP